MKCVSYQVLFPYFENSWLEEWSAFHIKFCFLFLKTADSRNEVRVGPARQEPAAAGLRHSAERPAEEVGQREGQRLPAGRSVRVDVPEGVRRVQGVSSGVRTRRLPADARLPLRPATRTGLHCRHREGKSISLSLFLFLHADLHIFTHHLIAIHIYTWRMLMVPNTAR